MVNAIIMFKTGDSQGGDHELRVVMHSEGRKPQVLLEKKIPFTSLAHGGANVYLNFPVNVTREGTFWLHVFLDGKRHTRMPYNIKFVRVERPSIGAADTKIDI